MMTARGVRDVHGRFFGARSGAVAVGQWQWGSGSGAVAVGQLRWDSGSGAVAMP